MFDDKKEDNIPILNELNTIITQEPTLEELNKEEDHLEFTNETTWTFTEEDRERVKDNNKDTLEEPVLTGGSSSSGTTSKVSEDSPTSVKNRVAEIEKAVEKTKTQNNLGLTRRKYTPMQRPKPEKYSQVIPSGSVSATV